MKIPALKTNKMPKVVPLRKIIGPSFIILGLGLGSGEVILWPYLASNYGMGIIWGALLGLSFQFIMNMEIERYALARGESVFVGLARKLSWLPFWFILSTFLPWMWPGIAAASATVLGNVFGLAPEHNKYFAIVLLVAMGLILSLGPVLYKTVERLQKTLIFIGVPSIFIISVLLADGDAISATANGIVGNGDGYFLLPAGIAISSFLAALAYAGAGGNLNLAQSFYVKEKGFGMGKYSGRITSLFTGKKSAKKASQKKSLLTGSKFDMTKENIKEFNKWWRVVNIEHFLVFWLTGSITIILLALLAYTTTYGTDAQTTSDISFVLAESVRIGELLFPAVGTFFLIVVGCTLFGTQLTVYDATSRIITENIILASRGKIAERHIPKVYYFVLWAFIIAGIIVFLVGFTQPLQLLFIAAILNAIAMFIHSGLTLWLNKTSLPKQIAPNKRRTFAMSMAFLFYGSFSLYVVFIELQKLLE
jgi:hypothetical protein